MHKPESVLVNEMNKSGNKRKWNIWQIPRPCKRPEKVVEHEGGIDAQL